MAVVELTKDNFERLVLTDATVLIDCWAPGCQGCDGFAAVFEAASGRHLGPTFAKLNTRDHPELTKRLSVTHVPTLLLFRDGLLLLRQPGQVPAEGLDEIVDKAEALDMEHVRAEMEKERSGSSD
jgi:thioredoxin 1